MSFVQNYYGLLRVQILLLLAYLNAIYSFNIDSEGCGSTKSCLIKPTGCKPDQDCTLFVKFDVDGKNLLHIQMAALTIIPLVPLQYIAVGFSNDKLMGDDMVIECVVSTDSQYGYFEPEVYTSYNYKASNDRTYLSEWDRQIYFRNISGGVVDEIVHCEFWVQIIPQIVNSSNRTWNLNKEYYILAATGTAQPDELNAHDTSAGSYFYPIVSDVQINPAKTGSVLHDLSDVQRRYSNRTVDHTPLKAHTAKQPTSSAVSLLQIYTLDIKVLFLVLLLTHIITS
uniref:DOMON domain-containing protein n=1 Tax=Syphacia muris TaxID=451379 RepID=A0A0N5ARN7_9BILA